MGIQGDSTSEKIEATAATGYAEAETLLLRGLATSQFLKRPRV
jgi:hypothetical protein